MCQHLDLRTKERVSVCIRYISTLRHFTKQKAFFFFYIGLITNHLLLETDPLHPTSKLWEAISAKPKGQDVRNILPTASQKQVEHSGEIDFTEQLLTS